MLEGAASPATALSEGVGRRRVHFYPNGICSKEEKIEQKSIDHKGMWWLRVGRSGL